MLHFLSLIFISSGFLFVCFGVFLVFVCLYFGVFLFVFLIQDMLSFILESEGGRNTHLSVASHTHECTVCTSTGIKPETQASALTRNGTYNLSVHRKTPTNEATLARAHQRILMSQFKKLLGRSRYRY